MPTQKNLEKRIVEKRIDELGLETQTKPSGAKPQLKQTKTDMAGARILVVSPYGQLNVYFESTIPTIVRGALVDIVDRAELRELPYVNVEEREKSTPRPLWLIDFGMILGQKLSLAYIREHRRNVLRSALEKFAEIMSTFPGDDYCRTEDLSEHDFKQLIDEHTKEFKRFMEEYLSGNFKSVPRSRSPDHFVTDAIPFDGYLQWGTGKGIVYITPRKRFARALKENHFYDDHGNFLSHGTDVKNYTGTLSRDLQTIADHASGSPLDRLKLKIENLELLTRRRI